MGSYVDTPELECREPFDMNDAPNQSTELLWVGVGLALGMMVAGSGCQLEAPEGCNSQTDCRGNRVCAPTGECVPPGSVDAETSVDGDDQSSDSSIEGEVASIVVRNRCGPADQQIVDFSFSSEASFSCESEVANHVSARFEYGDFEDINSPGDIAAGTDGGNGSLSFCTPSNGSESCISVGESPADADLSMSVDSLFVEDGIVEGSYELTVSGDTLGSENGGTWQGDLAEADVCEEVPPCG